MSSSLESYVNHTVSVITADGRQIVIDDLVDLYREFAKTPIPISGQLSKGPNERQLSVRIDWKVRDMDRLEATKHAVQHTIKLSKDYTRVKHIQPVGQPMDVTDELSATARAPVTQYMAVVRKGSKDPESGKQKQWLEIWDQTSKMKSIDINAMDEHSALVLEPTFGRVQWSPNGKQLLYVADYKPPKAQSYYKKVSKKSDNSVKESDTRGQEFVYREDWGECFDGITHTVIAVLDVENDFKIRTIEMPGYSLGQPFWTDSTGNTIGFVGFVEEPRRLGLVFCMNRKSSVFTVDLRAEKSVPVMVCGSEPTHISSPRPLPDGTGFVYLEDSWGGPHGKARHLMRYNFESKTSEVVVDSNGRREIIDTTEGPRYGKVCTIFTPVSGVELLDNPFTTSGKYLVINSFTELEFKICLVHLKTGQLIPIEFPRPSAPILDFKDNVLVVSGSAIDQKPNVFIGKLNDNDVESPVEWVEVETNSKDSLKDITVESYWIPSDDRTKLLPTILVSPKQVAQQPAPTIVIPHGGPHSILHNTYGIYPALFARIGLKTLIVNYRGSLGVDEGFVNDLIGHVGDKDVKDMIKAIDYMSDKNLVDRQQLSLFGGSHGGFIVTHLSGQYAHWDWKACITRNPVMNLATMLDGTDIPDWGYVEAFGKPDVFAFDKVLDPMTAEVMIKKSPTNWIHNVKVPTLMMLGRKDRRVPMTQGLSYYRVLKARGVKTECHVYDDKHDLQKVDVDGDVAINACLWILHHLK